MHNEIENSYFKKSIPELIDLLLSYRKKEIEFDQEKFDALLSHFKTRHVTNDQNILIQKIIRSDVESLQSEQFNNIKHNINSYNFGTPDKDKYPGLRVISKIATIFAYLIAAISAMVIIYAFLLPISNAFFISIFVFLIGGLFTLILLALSESIMVFIDIEENTRKNRFS